MRPIITLATLLLSASAGHAGGRAANEVYPGLAVLGDPVAVRAPAVPAPVGAAAKVAGTESADQRPMGRHAARWSRRRSRHRFAVEVPVARPPSASAPAASPALAPLPPTVGGGVSVVEKSVAGPVLAIANAEGPREQPSPTLTDLIAKHAKENGVPVELARAVVRVESRGNARASHGGALGLMQIKPGTARSVGFSGGASTLFSPDVNLRFGMKVLGAAYKSAGGDVCRTLAQYQSGARTSHLSRSNRAYCSRARAAMAGA